MEGSSQNSDGTVHTRTILRATKPRRKAFIPLTQMSLQQKTVTQKHQTLKKSSRAFSFATTRQNIAEVLADHELASLGDAYINFAYSLALSNRSGKPSGSKVKGVFLAEALRKTGLRDELPARMTTHAMADATEALIVYAWLQGIISLEESVSTLQKTDDIAEGLTQLLTTIKRRIKPV